MMRPPRLAAVVLACALGPAWGEVAEVRETCLLQVGAGLASRRSPGPARPLSVAEVGGGALLEGEAARGAVQRMVAVHTGWVVLAAVALAGTFVICVLAVNLNLGSAGSGVPSMPFTPVGAAATLNGCPSVKEGSAGAALFIIDPQVDFHEGGPLEVPGATGDSQRIAGLITKNIEKIDHIFVSLDSHHRMHIAHSAFWVDAEGKSPAPFTEILAAEVEAGKFKAVQPEMREWALKYCKALEAGGRFKHLIWPYHCLMGTPGHAVAPALMPALDKWSQERGRAITWVLKGQNNHTEMYSALKAEVPVPGDPTTELNTKLIADLANHSQVIVCGEAKSHCVNWTTRDLVSGWPKGRPFSDIVVLSDGTCPVSNFEKMADAFFADMAKQGVSIVKADAWVPKA